MLMNTRLKVRDTTGGVDRKHADAIARRTAKAALIKATVLWDLGQYRDFFRSEQEFLDFAYDYTYQSVLRKAIAKQRVKI